MDTHGRSLIKTATWRVTATFTTFVIAWALTGSLTMGLGIAGIEFWAKIVLYYLHERIWNSTRWGTK